MRSFPGQLFSVFFGSRKVALISSLFSIAVAALLYISYLQIKDATHIELPTGQADRIITETSTARASQKILILNSYHAGHVWSDNDMAGGWRRFSSNNKKS